MNWLLSILAAKCYKESISILDAVNETFELYESATSFIKQNLPPIIDSPELVADLKHYSLLNSLSKIINVCFSFDSLLFSLINNSVNHYTHRSITLPLVNVDSDHKSVKNLLLSYCLNTQVQSFIKPSNGYTLPIISELSALNLEEAQYPSIFLAIADLIAIKARDKILSLFNSFDRLSLRRYLIVLNEIHSTVEHELLQLVTIGNSSKPVTANNNFILKTINIKSHNGKKRSLEEFSIISEENNFESQIEYLVNAKASNEISVTTTHRVARNCSGFELSPIAKTPENSRRALQYSHLFKAISDASNLLSEKVEK
ncbi:hypothetical protein BB561_005808 [Smittium simulii]|uniref:Uncharacterized protein n=1 Tax=Smittium simulii TaxID=133385 RepID=A0A2T9Y863_9FUNG|nr:hypothetical protein BB561_005808 [Smittium simulii]